MFMHPINQLTTITTISPDFLQSLFGTLRQFIKHQLSSIPVLNVGRMYHHFQQITDCIHHNMPLASFDFLARIIPAFTTRFGRFHTLAIQNTSCWFWRPSRLFTHLSAQRIVDTEPGSVFGPFVKVVAYAGPVRKVSRDQSPLAASSLPIEQCVEDLAQIGYGCFDDQAERYTFADEGRASSLDELLEFLADYTPEKVAEISGVPAATIRSLAEVYGNKNRGTVSLWCMGVNQHTRGTWMNNLINDLHLITGKISRPGNNPLSLTGQPSACGTAREVGTLSNRLPADMLVTDAEHRAKAEEIWGLEPGTIPEKPGYHTVDMFRALVRGDVKAMWIQTTNPWVTLPNLHRFERTPGDGRFVVVSDIYPTPTTAAADLILPSAAWVEREGVFGNTERRTQQWNKLVDPPGEATEDAWQIIQVAKRMGMGHLFPWSDDNWHEPMFEEYRRFTLGIGKDLASYQQLKEVRGLRWPVVDGQETRYRYAAGYDPYVKADEGAHFYKAKKFGEKAAFWLRPYHPPAEMPDEDYPFWLSTGRVLEHWHTGSMTRRVKQLHQAVPYAYVELNRADAVDFGIQDGDRVKLTSRRGELLLPARIDGRGKTPQGTVFVPFFDEMKLVNRLTLDAMDNISYEPDYKKCAVRVERA